MERARKRSGVAQIGLLPTTGNRGSEGFRAGRGAAARGPAKCPKQADVQLRWLPLQVGDLAAHLKRLARPARGAALGAVDIRRSCSWSNTSVDQGRHPTLCIRRGRNRAPVARRSLSRPLRQLPRTSEAEGVGQGRAAPTERREALTRDFAPKESRFGASACPQLRRKKRPSFRAEQWALRPRNLGAMRRASARHNPTR